MNQLTDEVIIDQVLNGKVDAYSILIDRYKSYTYTIVCNILKVEEEAEEATQDVFIKAYKNLAKFNKDSKFSTWLYRIAFNTALTAKRKQKPNVAFENDLHSPLDFQKDARELDDRKKYITLAMSRLNEADNAALTLFYFEELSLEEICQVTDITLSTLKVRLHRARKRFAKELQTLLQEEAISL